MSKISASLEDYLEGVYFLREKKETVRVADLANFLGVKKPSVVKSLVKLKAKGLVRQEPYGHIEFTPAGQRLAVKITQRHRILKDFFRKILSVDEKIAEEDACRIEHVIHPQTFQNLTKFIKFIGIDDARATPQWLQRYKGFLKTGKKECCRKKTDKGKNKC